MINGTNSSGLKGVERDGAERLKLILLSAIFFLVIGAYTLVRDIKNAVFIGLVGKDYIPAAKVIFLIALVPLILFYSRLVDRTKRHYLLGIYSTFYAIFCLISVFLVGHQTIGIPNTFQSPYRIFGWFFYFLIEGFSPFVLSVFWAYVNSVNSPSSAKKNYGFLVSGSQLGGIFTAGLAWALFSMKDLPFVGAFSDVIKLRFILAFSAVLLFLVPLLVWLLVKYVPENCMHGYEAAHKIDDRVEKCLDENLSKKDSICKKKVNSGGVFKGLQFLLQYPYVFGIFAMTFFYELVTSILGYLRLSVAEQEGGSIAGISEFLFKWVFIQQSVGLLISFFGTSSLLRKLGIRICVFMIPLMVTVFVLFFVFSNNASIIMLSFTLIKSLNYAFSKPVVESLYIPTLRDIKFKSKSWIDSFGSKASKSLGSFFNLGTRFIPSALQYSVYVGVFAFLLFGWLITALLLGKRFDKAIESNEVIGAQGVEN